jgi:hypothetical protein
MKSLKTIIKLKKQEIDDKKIIISSLEKERDQLDIDLENLKKELLLQQQLIKEDPQILFSYSNYAKHNNDLQSKILTKLNELYLEIEKLSQELYDLFGDFKKYEIILENKQKRLIYEANKKEDIDLNELIVNKYNTNNN